MMSAVLRLKILSGGRVTRGIDHYWSIIMKRHSEGLPFTAAHIDDASRTDKASVNDYVRRLEAAGLIERISDTPGKPAFRPLVIQSSAPRVRRDGSVIESATGQKCMWNAMRSPSCRLGFTVADLVTWASTDETIIKLETAKAYVKTLASAGYLILVDKGDATKKAMWRLDPAMNTGPLPPMILRTKFVFDQNRNKVFGEPETEEMAS